MLRSNWATALLLSAGLALTAGCANDVNDEGESLAANDGEVGDEAADGVEAADGDETADGDEAVASSEQALSACSATAYRPSVNMSTLSFTGRGTAKCVGSGTYKSVLCIQKKYGATWGSLACSTRYFGSAGVTRTVSSNSGLGPCSEYRTRHTVYKGASMVRRVYSSKYYSGCE